MPENSPHSNDYPFEEPVLPVAQQAFTYPIELSPGELAYVEAAFARLVDYLIDNTPEKSKERTSDNGIDIRSTTAYPETRDGRQAEVTMERNLLGVTLCRRIIIPWAKEYEDRPGESIYDICYYGSEPAIVCRLDDPLASLSYTDHNQQTGNRYPAILDKMLDYENNQPIGPLEILSLQKYLAPRLLS